MRRGAYLLFVFEDIVVAALAAFRHRLLFLSGSISICSLCNATPSCLSATLNYPLLPLKFPCCF